MKYLKVYENFNLDNIKKDNLVYILLGDNSHIIARFVRIKYGKIVANISWKDPEGYDDSFMFEFDPKQILFNAETEEEMELFIQTNKYNL